MPGHQGPVGGAQGFAGELRGLVRAAEQRAGRKIDRASLARAVHISPQSLYAYLGGSRLPPAGTLDALLIELGAGERDLRRLAAIRDLAEESRRSRADGGPAGSGPAGAADELPEVAAVPQVRYSLPADTAAFTGRDRELEQVTAAASAGAVVAIAAVDGMPGVGKTAFAVHAAHVLAAQFPDRQLFIDLHGHTPGHEPVRPEDALAGLLAATGVDSRYLPGDLGGRAAMWRDRMAGQRALLVLDNAAGSGQVAPLFPGSGGCLVLVTSRRHLGDLPGAVTVVPVDVLTADEAARMFTRLSRRACGDPDGVAELVRLAGFLPLAVSLLARVFARHQSWTIADLVAENRAGVLTMAAEHDSLATAFEVSYRHLDLPARRLFRLLGVHPGAVIDRYAAAALARVGPGEAAGLLDGLHKEGLVTEAGYRRYGMHDLLRRYACDLAAADASSAENQQALGRVLDYYQHAAALADRQLARQVRPARSLSGQESEVPDYDVPELEDAGRALAWARADRASLLACLDLAARTGQQARVVALTAGLAALLRRDGPWAEADARHAAAVAAARHQRDRLGEANALADLGDTRRLRGDHVAAARVFEQALAIYRDTGSRLGEANTLTDLGTVLRLADDYPGAARILEEALTIYRDLGDRLGEANALRDLGTMRYLEADYPAAVAGLEQALGICRDLGSPLSEASALRELGIARRLTGDFPRAAAALERALGIYRDFGDRLGEANSLNDLGNVRQVAGDLLGAAEALERALDVYRDLGYRLGEAHALANLGNARLLTGDYPVATRVLEQALGIFRSLGSRLGEANAVTNLGISRRLTGDYPGAAQALKQGLAIFRDLGDLEGVAVGLRELGIVRRLSGDHPGAAEATEKALHIFTDLGDQQGQSETLNEHGTLYRIRGDTVHAQACHQQALDLARRIGSSRDEASALAGLGRCALATGDATQAVGLLKQAHEIFGRIGASESRDILAEISALSSPGELPCVFRT